MKVLAVGDVHQKEWIFDKVEKVAHEYDKVIFLGDIVDNFGSSAQDRLRIVERAIELCNKFDNISMLCGNHDRCYTDSTKAGMYSGWDPSAQMLFNGSPKLKSWLADLPEILFHDGVIYSHAGITDDWGEDKDPFAEDGHMWVRPELGYVYRPYQVFGHTPSKTCWEVQKDVWCIDTFSQHRDGTHYGDCTVLEIIDGKGFNVIKL